MVTLDQGGLKIDKTSGSGLIKIGILTALSFTNLGLGRFNDFV
jgi:hypothetical protein